MKEHRKYIKPILNAEKHEIKAPFCLLSAAFPHFVIYSRVYHSAARLSKQPNEGGGVPGKGYVERNGKGESTYIVFCKRVISCKTLIIMEEMNAILILNKPKYIFYKPHNEN